MINFGSIILGSLGQFFFCQCTPHALVSQLQQKLNIRQLSKKNLYSTPVYYVVIIIPILNIL
jgi:hypothetical protein